MHRLVSTVVLAGMLSASVSFAQTGVPAVSGSSAVAAPDARSAFVDALVKRWGPHVTELYHMDASVWAANMAQTFASASLDALAQATQARTFTAMNETLVASSGVEAARDVAQKLGDIAIDLVYVPVTPCRIFDTRVVGGPITANSTRNFDITSIANYSV